MTSERASEPDPALQEQSSEGGPAEVLDYWDVRADRAACRHRILVAVLSLFACVAIPAVLFLPAMWLGGAGHGSMCLVVLVFPAAFFGESFIGGLVQWAVYGLVLSTAALYGRWRGAFGMIVIAHVLAIILMGIVVIAG